LYLVHLPQAYEGKDTVIVIPAYENKAHRLHVRVQAHSAVGDSDFVVGHIDVPEQKGMDVLSSVQSP